MGYRSQDNRDAAEPEARKRLPLRDHYDRRLVAAGLVIVAAFAAGLVVRLKFGAIG